MPVRGIRPTWGGFLMFVGIDGVQYTGNIYCRHCFIPSGTIWNYTVIFSSGVNYIVTKRKPRSNLTGNYFSRLFIRTITKSTSFVKRVKREIILYHNWKSHLKFVFLVGRRVKFRLYPSLLPPAYVRESYFGVTMKSMYITWTNQLTN